MRGLIVSVILAILATSVSAGDLNLNDSARVLAGVAGDSVQVFSKSYTDRVQKAWLRYERAIGIPLRKWAVTEVPSVVDQQVFYPFSGPDFLTIAQVYPDADQYTLVAIQKASKPQRPDASDSEKNKRLEAKMGHAWDSFGSLGFFRTLDLDDDLKSENPIGVTTILMAFAARLDYEVLSVEGLAFDTATASWKTDDSANRGSVRIMLRKNGRPVVLDYISLDLSDNGIVKSPALQRWIIETANSHVLLKAASHLLQKSYFEIMRNTIISNAKLIVQDETGLNYSDLAEIGDVQLYGQFSQPLALFSSTRQETLSLAYQKNKSATKPLPFSFSYLKAETNRSLQIVSPQKRALGKI